MPATAPPLGSLLAAALLLLAAAPTAAPAVATPPATAPAPAAASRPLPRVLVIATGGTIAAAGYAGERERKSGELIEAIPGVQGMAAVASEDPITIGSSQITPEILMFLVKHVKKRLADDPGLAGIVVTQGTDSLEETAFFFDLLVAADRPVVFTAAMRLPTEVSPDGPRNLRNAIRLAASPAARGLGVLVTMNDEIHAAREVRKASSSAVNAFESPAGGPIGYLDGDGVFLLRKPLRRITLDSATIEPKVDLVISTVGSDGRQVRESVAAGAKAIVVELFGRGNAPQAMFQEMAAAAGKGVVIVVTSRTGSGRAVLGDEVRKLGILSGEDLDGLKARTLLIVALGKTRDPAVLQGYFEKLAGKV